MCSTYVYQDPQSRNHLEIWESWDPLEESDTVPDGCTPFMFTVCTDDGEELDGGFYYGYRTPDDLAEDLGFTQYIDRV